MSENVFRAQLSSWRNSVNVVSNAAAEEGSGFLDRLKTLNPFGSDSLRLPTAERATISEDTVVEEPGWFTLSRWDRIIIFGACLAGAVLFFTLCIALLPVLALKPRKFAVLWSLGSLLFVISFGVLQGPLNFLLHLVSNERILFTITFFGSIILTLVASLSLRSTVLTLIFVILQMVAALWYVVSYFPMGSQSLKFASRIGARQVTSWINS